MVLEIDVPDDRHAETGRSATLRRRWRTPPGRWFLLAVLAALVTLVWSTTYPDVELMLAIAAAWMLVPLCLIWLVRLVGWALAPDRSGGRSWWAAPAMVAVAVGAAASGLPLRARFELSRETFDHVASQSGPQGSFDRWVEVKVPRRIGTYRIRTGYRVGNALILYEADGGFIDDVGFAYLPDGPDARLANGGFEAPSFHHLGGAWYSFSAGW